MNFGFLFKSTWRSACALAGAVRCATLPSVTRTWKPGVGYVALTFCVARAGELPGVIPRFRRRLTPLNL